MVTINELLDLNCTIAAELFEGKTYPWEVLDEIKPFILKLGETLSPEEFDHPEEGVWRYCSETLRIEIFRRTETKPETTPQNETAI